MYAYKYTDRSTVRLIDISKDGSTDNSTNRSHKRIFFLWMDSVCVQCYLRITNETQKKILTILAAGI